MLRLVFVHLRALLCYQRDRLLGLLFYGGQVLLGRRLIRLRDVMRRGKYRLLRVKDWRQHHFVPGPVEVLHSRLPYVRGAVRGRLMRRRVSQENTRVEAAGSMSGT